MESDIKNLEKQLSETITHFKEEVSGIRTNRPTTKLVEDLKVDYFGQKMAVKQLGSISIVPPRGLQITAWDQNAVKLIAKAVEESSLGVAANIQGNSIHINLPPLTEERRRELVKIIRSAAENHKIKIRSLRDDVNKKIKKAEEGKEINEDQKFKFQERAQEFVNKTNNEIELALNAKIKEIEE